MSEKLCVFCNHLEFDTSGCHGDYPDPAYMQCTKGHWSVAHNGWKLPEEFRASIQTAATCPDYDEAKP
jgi:hypothetical protein